jgi:hypothetical protein
MSANSPSLKPPGFRAYMAQEVFWQLRAELGIEVVIARFPA